MRAQLCGAGGSNPCARSSFSKILRRTLSLMRAQLREKRFLEDTERDRLVRALWSRASSYRSGRR
jgi:hypothetical protein